MGVKGNKLEVNIVLAEGFLYGVGSFVIEGVESGDASCWRR